MIGEGLYWNCCGVRVLGFLTSIFGGAQGSIWTVLFALFIVVALIVAGVWALKLVFKASGSIVRGRQRRLALIDTMAIDSKRQLVLIRRDDVEHLIITGSTSDLVIETGIPVPAPAEQPSSGQNAELQAARIQPTMERAGAAAQRLGLSNILRRKNAHGMNREQDNRSGGEDESKTSNVNERPGPLDRLRNLGNVSAERTTPSLRHTGLLRPVSNLEVANLGASRDNLDKLESENGDSDMNKIDEVDLKAMESIEEGATPQDAGAQVDDRVETPSDDKESTTKSG